MKLCPFDPLPTSTRFGSGAMKPRARSQGGTTAATAGRMNRTPDDSWDDITERRRLPAGARVLVVDDDGDIRELVNARLTSEGYDVHVAASGVELLRAIESINAQRWPLDGVDLILLDNRMPGMTGLEMVRRLRVAHWQTPAILMTAFPESATRTEAAAIGAQILPKPFSLDLMTSAILLSLLAKSEHAADHHGFRVPA